MSSRSELEVKSRLVLGLGLLSIGLAWLLKLLWPVLVVAGLGAGGYHLWRQQYLRYLSYQRRQDQLTEKFYALLQRRQGRMSALEFAMHSRINGPEAQRYLHSQAQAFGAFFERTVHGDIVYIFNLAVVFSLEPSYAPPAFYTSSGYTSSGYASPGYRPITPAERAWADGPSSTPMPTVRGRARNTHTENIKTIDVSAVNE